MVYIRLYITEKKAMRQCNCLKSVKLNRSLSFDANVESLNNRNNATVRKDFILQTTK